MDVPVPLLLSCLCPTQLLERRGFFSILDRQCMCDLQNLLKVSPKAGLNLSAASVPGNGQHNKHNSHFFLMSNLPLTANSYVPRPSGDYFPTQGIYSRTNSPVRRAPHTQDLKKVQFVVGWRGGGEGGQGERGKNCFRQVDELYNLTTT